MVVGNNIFIIQKKNRKDCPKLNNAIRKHGENNFIVSKLISCSLDKLNGYEEYYIALYESIKNGYNCAKGGDYPNYTDEQRNEVNKKIGMKTKQKWCTKEYREKFSKCIINNMHTGISLKKRTTSYLPPNIYEVKRRMGVLVGYTIRVTTRGKRIIKTFSSLEFTPEENLIKAKEYLKEIIESLKSKNH